MKEDKAHLERKQNKHRSTQVVDEMVAKSSLAKIIKIVSDSFARYDKELDLL